MHFTMRKRLEFYLVKKPTYPIFKRDICQSKRETKRQREREIRSEKKIMDRLMMGKGKGKRIKIFSFRIAIFAKKGKMISFNEKSF